MAAKNKDYKECLELQELATVLKTRYYEHLGYVDLDRIFFAEIHGEMSRNAVPVEVTGVSAAWLKQRLADDFDNKVYCIAVWAQEWPELDENLKEWLLFDGLNKIHSENNGKVEPYDCGGWSFMLEFLGVHWRSRTDLPSLTKGATQPIPLPMDETYEGETFTENELNE